MPSPCPYKWACFAWAWPHSHPASCSTNRSCHHSGQARWATCTASPTNSRPGRTRPEEWWWHCSGHWKELGGPWSRSNGSFAEKQNAKQHQEQRLQKAFCCNAQAGGTANQDGAKGCPDQPAQKAQAERPWPCPNQSCWLGQIWLQEMQGQPVTNAGRILAKVKDYLAESIGTPIVTKCRGQLGWGASELFG